MEDNSQEIPDYLVIEASTLTQKLRKIWVKKFHEVNLSSTYPNWIKALYVLCKDLISSNEEIIEKVEFISLMRLLFRLLGRMVAFAGDMIDIKQIRPKIEELDDPLINLFYWRFFTDDTKVREQIVSYYLDFLEDKAEILEPHEIFTIRMHLLTILMKKGKISKGLEQFEDFKRLYFSLEEPQAVEKIRYAQILEFIAYDFNIHGYVDEAFEYVKKSYIIAKQFSDWEYLGVIENTYSFIYQSIGNFSKAEHHLNNSRSYYEKIGVKQTYAILLSFVVLYSNLADFTKAIEYISTAKQLMIQDGKSSFLMDLNLAEIESYRKNYQEAQEIALNLMERLMDEKQPNFNLVIYTLQILIRSHIELNQLSEAKIYLNELKAKINDEMKLWQVYYRYLRGLYELKQQNLGSAKNYLINALNLNLSVNDFALSQEIVLKLVEMLIKEYQLQQTQDIYLEALSYANYLIEDASSQKFYIRLVESYFVRGTLLLTQEKYNLAKADFQQALLYQHKYQLVSAEMERKIQSQLDDLEKTNTSRLSLKTLLKNLKTSIKQLLGAPINIQGRGQSIIPEILGLQVITTTEGLPLYSHYFNDELRTDAMLLSGLLSAVQTYTNALLQSQGIIQGIQHQDIQILIETSTPEIYCVLFAKAEHPLLRKALTIFSRKINQKYKSFFQTEGMNTTLPEEEINRLIQQTFNF